MSDRAERSRFLKSLFESSGNCLRFDRWMAAALYDPDFGYYMKGIRAIGGRGDFTTWPELEGSVAAALRKRLGELGKSTGISSFVEIGAGNGALAGAILKLWGWFQKPDYHIVDVSGPLREIQKARLKNRVTWHEHPASAMQACQGRALIFANELVDAFPCRVFRRTQEAWDEIHLTLEDGRIREIGMPVTDLPESTAWAYAWKPGQRVEIHESFHQWLETWLLHCREGHLLLIDYGGEAPEIHRQNPMGTLRAYARHQVIKGPEIMDSFGFRDLTADVNFSDVRRSLEHLGWTCRPLITLADFLQSQKVQPSDPRLLDPSGAAGCFQVLEAAKVTS